jgi:hypothetical protein
MSPVSTRSKARAGLSPRQRRSGFRRRGGRPQTLVAAAMRGGGGSAAPSRRLPQRLPTPGADRERRGRADRAGPRRVADAAERGEAAGPGARTESGGGDGTASRRGRSGGGAARSGSRLTRAAAAADSHGPQQRRGRRGGERRRGGTRRGSKGGGFAAPFQLFPQQRHPARCYDSEGSAVAGLETVVHQAAQQAATNLQARRQVKSHGEKVLLTLMKEIQLSGRMFPRTICRTGSF